jgi:hypothetical protein
MMCSIQLVRSFRITCQSDNVPSARKITAGRYGLGVEKMAGPAGKRRNAKEKPAYKKRATTSHSVY